MIAKYQLELASGSDTVQLNEIQDEYESIVIKTGFKRFTVEFLTQYLAITDSN